MSEYITKIEDVPTDYPGEDMSYYVITNNGRTQTTRLLEKGFKEAKLLIDKSLLYGDKIAIIYTQPKYILWGMGNDFNVYDNQIHHKFNVKMFYKNCWIKPLNKYIDWEKVIKGEN